MKKIIISITTAVLTLLLSAACTMESDYIARLHEKISNDINPPSAATYTVTYDGNGNDGGTVPVDGNEYKEGESVSVLGNSGSMEKFGLHFSGWNTTAEGSGSGYISGESLIMGSQNITLYAQWAINTYILSLTAGTGGSISQPGTSEISVIHGVGTTITADADSGYAFSGWEVTSGTALIDSVLSQSSTVILNNGDAGITANFSDENAPDAPLIQGVSDGYLTNESFTFTLAGFEDNYQKAEYSLDGGNTWYLYSSSITVTSEGEYEVAARQFDQSGNSTLPGDILASIVSVIVDKTEPNAPIVDAMITNDQTPLITWTSSGGGGNGHFRVQRETSGWQSVEESQYQEITTLAQDSYIYYVQERDEAGNWSDSGLNTIEIDTTSPGAPTVNCTSATTDTTPTWTWISGGGGGNGFSYKLDSGGWNNVSSATTVFTPSFAISQTAHTLYVVEKDAAGNISNEGQASVTIDLPAPLLITPADQADIAGTTTNIDWSDLSWAVSYYIQEADDSSFTSSVENWETVNSASTCGVSLQLVETVYLYWRVRGKNSDGSYGTWSSTRRIDFHPLWPQ